MSITHWFINESPTQPDANDPGWLAEKPTSYVLSPGYGTKNVYAWARDEAGNISSLEDQTHFSVTYIAPPCPSLEAVQNAVNMAKSGDVILLSPKVRVWNGTLHIPDSKKIILRGSGTGKSIIRATGPGEIIHLGKSPSIISGFEFIFEGSNSFGILAESDNWRIDHCKFQSAQATPADGVRVIGSASAAHHPQGLVDHCEFVNARVNVFGESNPLAHIRWAEPLTLGSETAVYVEDCTFTNCADAINSRHGGRYVFRYNSLNNSYIVSGSIDGTNRAGRSWEIYNNSINLTAQGIPAAILLRGGTGVVFNNSATGYCATRDIGIDNIRSFTPCGEGGLADGSSPWDGNQETNGYPARDQIGRSTDEWLWTDAHPYPPQALEPAHCWENFFNGGSMFFEVLNGCEKHIKQYRDFYINQQPPPYQPYVYPHPLSQFNPTKVDIYIDI